MKEPPRFTIGATVRCEDGECGVLRAVVVDPEYAISHLVVEARHRRNKGHLVPVELVDGVGAGEVQLHCTLVQFGALDPAEETEVRAEPSPDWEAQLAQAEGIRGLGTVGLGVVEALGRGMRMEPRGVTDINLLPGEGEVSRRQPVHASDGTIGHVHALLTDPDQRRVTHVVLGEGHLWGKRDVAIPVSAVKFIVDDGVHLNLTKGEVGALPLVNPERVE